MKTVDFFVLILVCLCWAGNFVVAAWALGDSPIPPFMLAATRASIVVLCLFPVLFWARPKHFGRLLLVCLLIGPVHLALLYTGLQSASATGSSVVAQLFIPVSTILSILFLKEVVGRTQLIAIAGALIGVIIMIYDPATFSIEIGLVFVFAAYVSMAIASILMKRVGDVPWPQFVVWMAVSVLIVCGTASAVFESDQLRVAQSATMPLLIAAAFSAVFVSIIAHGQYFNLIKRYDVSLIVPLTLMTPFFATVLGVAFLSEQIFLRYAFGAALIIPSVFVLARRGST